MYDPISVETALVSSGGDLLIQLSDGNIVNAGRVRGVPGPQGEQGENGIRGAHGKDGTNGTNGAQWHTGVGAPELAVGENGDMYMDVASALLPIFQKVNGNWLFLANLKVPPSGGGGGSGSGAAGGGGSIIIDGGTNSGGDGPTSDNNGKPVQPGDLWFDPETGYIYVYMGSAWIPVADRPPAIISPTPPNYNNASDDDPTKPPKYPVVEGDLWFDSEQLALYVAALDADGDLVWIISTPANRSGVDDAVAINPFVLPANATDRQEEYNAVTDTWYVYNAPKKQWIDFHPDDSPCLEIYGYILKFSAPDNPNAISGPLSNAANINFSIYSRTDYPNNRYNEYYLNDGDGTWQKIQDMDAATIAKYAIISVRTWDIELAGPANTYGWWVPGLETTYPDLSVKGAAVQKDEDGNDLVDENGDVITVESPAFRLFDDPCTSFDVRDLDPVIASCGPGQTPAKRYILAHGDFIDDAPTDPVQYIWKDSVWRQSGPPAGRDPDDYSYMLQYWGGFIFESPGTTEFRARGPWMARGNRVELQATGGYGLDLRSDGRIDIWANGASGDITLTADSGSELIERAIDDTDSIKQITNKEYVDTQNEILQQEIIELEEEIDAIAPSVERGSWQFNLSGAVSGPGAFTAYDEYMATSGNPIGLVTNIKSLWFHPTDKAGTPHGFDNVEPGNLLQLFVEGSEEYGLFEVVEVHNETGGAAAYWVIDVDFVRTLDYATRFDNGDICRLNIFAAPSGGDVSGFLLKTGDKVDGELIWEPYKAASGGDPVQNAYHGLRVYSRTGDNILFATTGGTYSAEDLTTDLVPTTPASICNKAYVDAAVSPGINLYGSTCKWRKNGNEGSTLNRYIYFEISRKNSESPLVEYGNVIYLDKLLVADGTLQPLENYRPTDISAVEVYVRNELYFKSFLNPATYRVSNRNPDEIVCDFSTEFALVAKGGTDFDISTTYTVIVTGMKYTG